MDWFTEGGSGSPCDVAAVLDSKGTEVLWELITGGALVSIGLTSDGGALGVTITVDGRWRREYFRTPEDFTEWMEEARDPVLAAAEDARHRRASSASRSGRRGR